MTSHHVTRVLAGLASVRSLQEELYRDLHAHTVVASDATLWRPVPRGRVEASVPDRRGAWCGEWTW